MHFKTALTCKKKKPTAGAIIKWTLGSCIRENNFDKSVILSFWYDRKFQEVNNEHQPDKTKLTIQNMYAFDSDYYKSHESPKTIEINSQGKTKTWTLEMCSFPFPIRNNKQMYTCSYSCLYHYTASLSCSN